MTYSGLSYYSEVLCVSVEKGELAHEVKALAVIGTDAVSHDGCAVVTSRIAFVLCPVIVWEFLGNASHILVTMSLGKDARSSYAHHLAVALDDGGEGDVAVGIKAVTVDEDVLGTHREPVKCPVHGSDRGLEDVDAVNFLGRDHSHSPCQSLVLDNGAQHVALVLGELLAVVEQFVVEVGRQNHSGSRDRSCQASTPCLVTPRLNASLL